MQQMIFIADLIACSTCFGHHYAHHQELESIIQVIAACGIWCFGFQVVGMVWSWGLCVRFAGCWCSRPQMTIRHMCSVYWISKAIEIHSEHLQLHNLENSAIEQYSSALSDDVSPVRSSLLSHFLRTGNHTQHLPSSFAVVGWRFMNFFFKSFF